MSNGKPVSMEDAMDILKDVAVQFYAGQPREKFIQPVALVFPSRITYHRDFRRVMV